MQVTIDPIGVLNGDLPRRAVSMVIEWAALHQDELLQNWQLVEAARPTTKIDPLD
jgi:hypothetical protein